jgi:hypothetical protein
MEECAGCGESVELGGPSPVLRSSGKFYHLTCAPADLVNNAAEEYQAILRKGMRYFVEKYSAPGDSETDLGSRFLALGRSIEEERRRRGAGSEMGSPPAEAS